MAVWNNYIIIEQALMFVLSDKLIEIKKIDILRTPH
jgi:hypothetical protein